MLKPHELFIGAVLNKKDKNGFSPLIIDAKYLAWIERDESFFNKTFQPIPLTPEILTDWCGWEVVSNGWSVCIIVDNWLMLSYESLDGLTISINGSFIYVPHIQYLHQLQALYQLLTGEVMTIKLPKNQ